MLLKNRSKAFTLVELVVVLAIFLIVGTILFYLLIKALRWTSTVAGEVKQKISVDINTDLLVFDLKHAGYGISKNEEKLAIEFFNGTSKVLVVRETTNIAKSSVPTTGFVLWNGTSVVYSEPSNAASSKYTCSWLTLDGFYNKVDKCTKGPDSLMSIGYPLDTTTVCKDSNSTYCCNNCPCTTILWFLNKPSKPSSFPENCIKGTFVLTRQAGSSFHNRIPVINCVADWDVWFAIDEDFNGTTDLWINEIPYSGIVETNGDLQNRLKLIRIYMLVQTSYIPDSNFDFCNAAGINCNSSHCPSNSIEVDTLKDSDGTVHYVCLKHPSNPIWNHYHWKVIEINVSNFPNIP